MRRFKFRSGRFPAAAPLMCGLCLLAVTTQVAATPAASGDEAVRAPSAASVTVVSGERAGALASLYAAALTAKTAATAEQSASTTVQAPPPAPAAPMTGVGVPANMLAAYQAAETTLAQRLPNCRLKWYHLAGIGKIESAHARGGQADERGETSPKILGPVLNGNGFAAIGDTDRGIYDGSAEWDRAVGPMQFIPGTWKRFGLDGNNDGVASPHNIFDAALSAGGYLCSGGMDLSRPGDLDAAVFRYNHSLEYVHSVQTWMRSYSGNLVVVSPLPPNTSAPETPPAEAPVSTDPGTVPPTTEIPPSTDPSAPADPSLPADPSQPVDPSQPTDPSQPVDPSQPADPTLPTLPTDPVNPPSSSEPPPVAPPSTTPQPGLIGGTIGSVNDWLGHDGR